MSDLMKEMTGSLEQTAAAFEEELASRSAVRDLEDLRVRYFGKKGQITTVLRQMGKLDPEERPVLGQMANDVRARLEGQLETALNAAAAREEEARLADEAIDLTLPGRSCALGQRHPISQAIDLISRAFLGMGFKIAEGPEVEFTRYNFDQLRIPEGHPSRDEKDTFYITDDIILRTQTSPVQIRVMEQTAPPIRIICPGKVYRTDTPDATHSPIFHQIEGLVVDKGVTMGDLVGSLQVFVSELFGEDTKVRLRPHHFPFTEPSCEVDVTCWKCHGSGCSTCKGEGYVELLGGGMVHPWVLEQAGIDPEVYSGFAFGIGVERTAMARFGIDDIRNLYDNNLRFLEQFK